MNILLQLSEETDLEDLPLKQFLKQLEDLSNFTISSQANDTQLFFGLDKSGVFYTSQWSPNNPDKFNYKVSDYPNVVQSNLFKTAHLALTKRLSIISKHLEPGQAVDCRVTFKSNGAYADHNNISIIRGTKGEISLPKKINALTNDLKDHQVQVRSKQLDTVDGSQLFSTYIISKWNFSKTKEMSGEELKSEEVAEEIKKLKDFLKLSNKIALSLQLSMSNFEVAVVNLTQIDMELRPKLKIERERLNQEILVKFKLPIKNELLTNLEDKLGSKSAIIHKKNNAVQIADADLFISVNDFNSQVKRQLYGMIRSSDPSATIEERGGLINVANQRIANLFGTPELTNFMSARKIFSDLRGVTKKETAYNFAENLENQDLYAVKGKINAILKYTLKELALKLADFSQNSTDYKLTSGDKEISYSPKVIKQTLLDFAEVKQQLEDLIISVKKAKNFGDIILTLYINVIDAAHKLELKEHLYAQISPLFMRINALDNILTTSTSEKNMDKMNITDLTENLLLNLSLIEDEMGASTMSNAISGTGGSASNADMGGPDPSTSGNTILAKDNRATRAGDIANFPKKLFKGKHIIKRKRDFVKKKKFANTFEGLDELSSLMQIDLVWNDTDFNGDPQTDAGFDYIKKEYKIKPMVVEHSYDQKFPTVRLIGSEVSIRNFVILEYHETSAFCKQHIKSFSGE